MDPATITVLVTLATKLLDVVLDGDEQPLSPELIEAHTLLRREMVKRAQEL